MVSQFLKFAFVGVVSNLLGYGIYLALTSLGSDPKLTMSGLYVVGATVGFFGNKMLTFKHSGDNTSASVRYMVAHFWGYLINLGILVIFVDRLGYAHQFVQAFGIVIVALTMYFLMKYFVFRKFPE